MIWLGPMWGGYSMIIWLGPMWGGYSMSIREGALWGSIKGNDEARYRTFITYPNNNIHRLLKKCQIRVHCQGPQVYCKNGEKTIVNNCNHYLSSFMKKYTIFIPIIAYDTMSVRVYLCVFLCICVYLSLCVSMRDTLSILWLLLLNVSLGTFPPQKITRNDYKCHILQYIIRLTLLF